MEKLVMRDGRVYSLSNVLEKLKQMKQNEYAEKERESDKGYFNVQLSEIVSQEANEDTTIQLLETHSSAQRLQLDTQTSA